MNFGDALAAMKAGKCIRRPTWTERNLTLILQGDSIRLWANGFNVPWVPLAADLMAEDWISEDPEVAA